MKKLIALIALGAVAGTASASILASEDFDGGSVNISSWAYGSNLDTSGGNASLTALGSNAGNSVGTLNTAINTGSGLTGSAGDVWVSYRFTMAAHSQWIGGSQNRTGIDRDWSGTHDQIGFKTGGDDGSSYGDYHMAIWAADGTTSHDTNPANKVISYNQNEDLFVVGLFRYNVGGSADFYMTTANWGSSVTEADVLGGFSMSVASAAAGPGHLIFDIEQPDGAAGAITQDNIIYGTTSADVGVIPEPATLGMVAMVGGGVLFIRRRLMM